MGKKSISSIFRQYEPKIYSDEVFREGKNSFNIFNLEYAKMYYFNLLYTLAVSIPNWENLPLEIDKSIMERILVNNGKVVIYYDDVLKKFLTLVLGRVNKYDTDGRPLEYGATTLWGNIRYDGLNPKNSVIIYDNVTQIPTFSAIEFYAGRLANLRLSIDQCVRNLKVPYIVTTTSNNKAAIEAILTEVYNYKPAILIDGVAEIECLKVTPLTQGIPDALKTSREEYTNTFNEALGALGIANVSQEESKRERMTEYEVAKTVTGSMVLQESRLKPRIQGAERMNALELWKPLLDGEVKVSFSRLETSIDGIDGYWDETNTQNVTQNLPQGGEENG